MDIYVLRKKKKNAADEKNILIFSNVVPHHEMIKLSYYFILLISSLHSISIKTIFILSHICQNVSGVGVQSYRKQGENATQ